MGNLYIKLNRSFAKINKRQEIVPKMFVLSSILSRETSFGKMHLKLTRKLQFDGQGFEAVLILEDGINSN